MLIWVASVIRQLLTGEEIGGPVIVSICALLALPVIDWILRAGLTAVLRIPGTPPAASPLARRSMAP